MPEKGTIEAIDVFKPRPAGKTGGMVVDVKTADGRKYSAWDNLGEEIYRTGKGFYDVEYTVSEKDGWKNYKLVKAVPLASEQIPGTNGVQERILNPSTPRLTKDEQINRSVAFKAAVDLTIAFGSCESPLDGLMVASSLTEDALLVVEGSATVDDTPEFDGGE